MFEFRKRDDNDGWRLPKDRFVHGREGDLRQQRAVSGERGVSVRRSAVARRPGGTRTVRSGRTVRDQRAGDARQPGPIATHAQVPRREPGRALRRNVRVRARHRRTVGPSVRPADNDCVDGHRVRRYARHLRRTAVREIVGPVLRAETAVRARRPFGHFEFTRRRQIVRPVRRPQSLFENHRFILRRATEDRRKSKCVLYCDTTCY